MGDLQTEGRSTGKSFSADSFGGKRERENIEGGKDTLVCVWPNIPSDLESRNEREAVLKTALL